MDGYVMLESRCTISGIVGVVIHGKITYFFGERWIVLIWFILSFGVACNYFWQERFMVWRWECGDGLWKLGYFVHGIDMYNWNNTYAFARLIHHYQSTKDMLQEITYNTTFWPRLLTGKHAQLLFCPLRGTLSIYHHQVLQ